MRLIHIRNCRLCSLIAIALFAIVIPVAKAQVPHTISYQGVIQSGGTSLSGQHLIHVTLYDNLVGGNMVYEESHQTTMVNGVFSIMLGSVTSFPDGLRFDKPYYLSISIDGAAELTPRTPLASVPYALNSHFAELASGLTNDAHGVVTSINEVSGAVRLIGDSTTIITQNGNDILVHSKPSVSAGVGIQSVASPDNTIGILNPKGPNVSVSVADNAITTSKIKDGAVTPTKLNQGGATNGQVLKWNGTSWVPSNDLSTTYTAGSGITINGNSISVSQPLPPGTVTHSTLRYNGTSWVENTNLLSTATGLTTVNNNLLLANSGTPSELHFYEPLGSGNNYSSFAAQAQGANINYLLPANPPLVNQVLAVSSVTGVGPYTVTLGWQNSGGSNWLLTGNSGTNSGTNFLGTTDGNPLAFRTSNLERMRLDANGNLGIGTNAPQQSLEVKNGNILLSNSVNAGNIIIAAPGGVNTTSITTSAQTSNITYKLPSAIGTANQVLQISAVAGNTATLGWIAPTTSGGGNEWLLTGNSGTTPGTNFLGTTDNKDFEIHVFDNYATINQGTGRVMKFQSMTGASSSPNIVGGYFENSITNTHGGSVIVGGGIHGGANTITNDYSTIHGGWGNSIATETSTIGGGGGNSITNASNGASTIAGGAGNSVIGTSGTVGGGFRNQAGLLATVAGGGMDTASGIASFVGGGGYDVATSYYNGNVASGAASAILGGIGNHAFGVNSSILGGAFNYTLNDRSTIAGGAHLRLVGTGSFGFHNGTSSSDSASVTANSTAFFGNVNLWLGNTNNTSSQLRFYEPQNGGVTFPGGTTNYSSFQAGSQTSDINYTLPASQPATGQVLSATAITGAGPYAVTLGWANGGGNAWNLTGNSGTTFGTNFIGTTDNVDLQFRVNNGQAGLIQVSNQAANTGFGYGVLSHNNTGTNNTGIGFGALNSSDGSFNTAGGCWSLNSNVTGNYNTSYGARALQSSTDGNYNTAVGERALANNGSANSNTAIGFFALYNNTTGTGNTADGYYVLSHSTTGNYNTAFGDSALLVNTTGSMNTALGHLANVVSNNLTNATSIGANAAVGQSNSMVLGSINGVNNAASDVKVGIGTTTPIQKFNVENGNILLSRTGSNGADSLSFQGTGAGVSSFTAGAQGTTNINYTLPTSQPTTNQVLAATTISGAGPYAVTLGWADPTGGSGFVNYGPTSLQATLTPRTTPLFNIAYISTAADANAAGAIITSSAGAAGNSNATGLTVKATATGTGLARAIDAIGRVNIDTSSSYDIGGNQFLWAGQHAYLSNVLVGINPSNQITTGSENTIVGGLAGSISNGSHNVMIGYAAGHYLSTGSWNIAIGRSAMAYNSPGDGNVAVGASAGYLLNTSATDNVLVGNSAGSNIYAGTKNTFVGTNAGKDLPSASTISYATGIGFSARMNVQVNNATAIGAFAEVDSNNALVLGSINSINGASADTKVGIGTTMPTQKFNVENGNILLSRSGTNAADTLQFQGTSTGKSSFVAGGQGTTNINYTLPTSQPTTNQVLSATAISGAGPYAVTLGWANGGGSAWNLTGNSGTTVGTNFLGTTDNQAFEIHVYDGDGSGKGSKRVMRFEPNATSANILGGYQGNTITSGVGATISGGGHSGSVNTAAGDYSTIAGGTGNYAFTAATVSGGVNNGAQGYGSFIGGGNFNFATSQYAVVSGGVGDTASGFYSVVAGGISNIATSYATSVLGGESNSATGQDATIGGGALNTAKYWFGTIGGGKSNSVDTLSAIPGGAYLKLAPRSFGFNGSPLTSSTVDLSNAAFSNIAYFGNVNMMIGNTDNTARELRFYEPNSSLSYTGTNFSSFKAATQTTDITYTLPTSQPTTNQVLAATAISGTGPYAVTLGWTDQFNGSGFVSYGPTSVQATLTPRTTPLFNIAYISTAAGANAAGATITSSAGTGGNLNATGLTVKAIATGTGLARAIDATGRVNIDSVSSYDIKGDQWLWRGPTSDPSVTMVGNTQSNSNTGTYNVFIGWLTGTANTTGQENTFTGAQTGISNTTGSFNSFYGGYGTAAHNTTGSYNSYFGTSVGVLNTTGSKNSYFGAGTGINETGSDNSFFGFAAGGSATTGVWNIFAGEQAGGLLTTGSYNTQLGGYSGLYNYSGSHNTYIGYKAGMIASGSNNTFIGDSSGCSNTGSTTNSSLLGSGSIILGTISNAAAIGAFAEVAADNALVLGSINGINGATSDVNVGIGTTSPLQKFNVENGNILLSRTGTNGVDSLKFQGTGIGVSSFAAGAQGTTNINYTLPITAPAANGNLLLATSGSSSAWSWSTGLVWDNTNSRLGINITTPSHPIHSVNSGTTDEIAAVYGNSTGSTTSQAIGMWGDASNTGTSNTGTIGVLATGNGNATAGQTNIALQINDGEFTMGRTSEAPATGTDVQAAAGGTAYSAQGPSGVVELTLGGAGDLVTAAPTANAIQKLTTITINNRYCQAGSIILLNIVGMTDDGNAPDPRDAAFILNVDNTASGSFSVRVKMIPAVTSAVNYAINDKIQIGYVIVNKSK